MELKESINQFVKEKLEYYKQWIFDEPIVISQLHNEKLLQLQKVMYKLIIGFVNNYQKYKYLMPVSEEIEQIINMCSSKEYQPGTYRTDFVYDANKHVKIIEITCRFGLNGIFLSALMNHLAEEYRASSIPDVDVSDQFDGIYDHLKEYLIGKDSVSVLIGDDQRNESKIFADIFERTGLPVNRIPYQEVKDHLEDLSRSFIVSELSFEEICSVDKKVLAELIEYGIFNDLRTIFLIHDKRFFSVMGNKELQEQFLSVNERTLFEKFYIPTYSYAERADLWEEARQNKDKWIIKHRSLGKSQKVFAGIVTGEKEWTDLFTSEDACDLVLQEWIEQQTMYGEINTEKYQDYITGTLLFFDDDFYGFGDFRTSSFPVTNKVDHRKMTSLVLSKNEDLIIEQFLNYIP